MAWIFFLAFCYFGRFYFEFQHPHSQWQESKDSNIKPVYSITYSTETYLQKAASHLNRMHSFPCNRLIEPKAVQGTCPRPNSYQLQNINAGQWRSSLYLMDNHRVTVCRQKSPYTEIYCQFISIYGKFVTSQTAYFSRAVNSVYCVV